MGHAIGSDCDKEPNKILNTTLCPFGTAVHISSLPSGGVMVRAFFLNWHLLGSLKQIPTPILSFSGPFVDVEPS
jgi:hypothetical protein